MPRQKQRPCVKVKDEEVIITFNAKGWDPAHGKLIESLGSFAKSRDIPFAEYVGRAFELKALELPPYKIDALMSDFRHSIALEEERKKKSINIAKPDDPDIK